MEELLTDPQIILFLLSATLVLGLIQIFLSLLGFALEKGDKEPFASAGLYLLVGLLGGIVLGVIIPIIGFFIGFPLILKLWHKDQVNFWGMIIVPISFVISMVGFFIGLTALKVGVEVWDEFILGIGVLFFFGTLYKGIVRPALDIRSIFAKKHN
jgi:hypothetical protein